MAGKPSGVTLPGVGLLYGVILCNAHGGIWRGLGGVRTYSWAYQHHPAHVEILTTVPVYRGVCGGVACLLALVMTPSMPSSGRWDNTPSVPPQSPGRRPYGINYGHLKTFGDFSSP
jgi:hypothetical protein